jgi:hypothetical protein
MAKKTLATKRTISSAPTPKSKTSKRKFNDDDLDIIHQALQNAGIKSNLLNRVLHLLQHPGATEFPDANRKP